MNYNGNKICDNCFSVIKGEPCPNCGYKKSKSKGEYGTLPVGTMLAKRYSVGQVLGRGGFGVTYKAWDTMMNRVVAVKEYYPNGLVYREAGNTGITVSDAKNTENFQTGAGKFYEEAKTVSRFNGNPRIVGVSEFFYENNTVYYVMEFLEGSDLKQFIKAKQAAGEKLSQEQVLFIAEAMTDALIITHSVNVLHRDISPDNIFVLRNGEIKLIDFGAARQVLAEQSKSLSVILKQGFAPLEQYQRKGKQGPWTDLYALGATLYYCLTGTVLDDVTERIDAEEIGTAEEHGVDPAFWAVIEKCVRVKATDRYQSAMELRKALDETGLKPEPLVSAAEEIPMTVAVPEGAQAIPGTAAVSGGARAIPGTVAVSEGAQTIPGTVAVSGGMQAIPGTVAVSGGAQTIPGTVAVSGDMPGIPGTKSSPVLSFLKSTKGIVTVACTFVVVVGMIIVIAVAASGGKKPSDGKNPNIAHGGSQNGTGVIDAVRPSSQPSESLPGTSEGGDIAAPGTETGGSENGGGSTGGSEGNGGITGSSEGNGGSTGGNGGTATEPEQPPAKQTVTDQPYSAPFLDSTINGLYTGEWENGKPSGQGKLVGKAYEDYGHPMDAQVKGTWVDGEFVEGSMAKDSLPDPENPVDFQTENWDRWSAISIDVGRFKDGSPIGTYTSYTTWPDFDNDTVGGSVNVFYEDGTYTNSPWDMKLKL